MSKRILIAGETGNHCLEQSFYKAYKEAGYEVKLYDTKQAVKKYARFGKWGFRVHQFFPVEAWLKKANKEFTEEVKQFKPDILIAFTGAEILVGSFAYIKSILPTRIVWYWADPLPNLSRYISQSLSLTDVVASYSRSAVDVFKQMGAKSAIWLPFAADIAAHFAKAVRVTNYKYDVSFIGSWRPEREEALKTIFENFPGIRFKISGPYWNRCSFVPIRKLSSTEPIYGKSFSDIVQNSFLNLNVIDRSNYPAVNMRFFEIIAAGGVELCSAGPEMSDNFVDRQHLLYFSDQKEMISTIQFAFANKEKVEEIKIAGQEHLLAMHLYSNRVNNLQSYLDHI